MNCPRCNKLCSQENYPSSDKRTFSCKCDGDKELFTCSLYYDVDIPHAQEITNFLIVEPPLFFLYINNGGPTWTIAVNDIPDNLLKKENQYISPNQAYSLLKKYKKLLAFT